MSAFARASTLYYHFLNRKEPNTFSEATRSELRHVYFLGSPQSDSRIDRT